MSTLDEILDLTSVERDPGKLIQVLTGDVAPITTSPVDKVFPHLSPGLRGQVLVW